MKNLQKWNLYTSRLPAPQSFLDFGFYYTIGCCLQRRVWFYGEGDEGEGGKLYPNQYVVFVGPPGCGKGIVLSKISYFLKYHKNEKGIPIRTSTGEEKPSLYSVGADSITFEELLDDIALSSRSMVTPEKKPYVYTAYAFVLQELDSLFRKKADDVIRFLKNAYDCGDYDRKTRHQGKTLLRRLCCSLIAGTQLDFLKEAIDSKIFGQGFASRTLFLFEHKERFDSFHISDLDDDQKMARDELLEYVKRLSVLYGEIKYSRETRSWLEDWYRNTFVPQRLAASSRMVDYMARKKVIMLKLAAAMHFSEELDLTIPTETFQRAITLLDKTEKDMEAGFSATGNNPLHSASRKMLAFIKSRGRCKRRDLVLEYSADYTVDEIEMCLKALELGHGLKTGVDHGEKVYYL
jgi:hypothetical protein